MKNDKKPNKLKKLLNKFNKGFKLGKNWVIKPGFASDIRYKKK